MSAFSRGAPRIWIKCTQLMQNRCLATITSRAVGVLHSSSHSHLIPVARPFSSSICLRIKKSKLPKPIAPVPKKRSQADNTPARTAHPTATSQDAQPPTSSLPPSTPASDKPLPFVPLKTLQSDGYFSDLDPVELFRAGPLRKFTIVAYAGGAMLVLFSVPGFWFYYDLSGDETINMWVRPVYAVTAALFVGLGGYIFTTPMRMIKSITIVPPAASAAGTSTSKASHQAMLHIIRSQLLPYPQDKLIIVPAGSLISTKPYWWLAQDLKEANDKIKKTRSLINDMYGRKKNGVLAAIKGIPTKMNYGMFKWYWFTRKRLLREGLIPLEYNGRQIGKLDVSDCTFHQDSRVVSACIREG